MLGDIEFHELLSVSYCVSSKHQPIASGNGIQPPRPDVSFQSIGMFGNYIVSGEIYPIIRLEIKIYDTFIALI